MLERRAGIAVQIAALVAIPAIGYVDYTLGFGFNLFPLYLIPLGLVAWTGSFPVAVLYSILAGTVIVLKVFLTKHLYARVLFPYWDAGVKCTLLLLISYGIWRIKQLMIMQKEQDAARISVLNNSLQRQVEQLTAANRELADVSYTISHDLRAPLRHIIGFVELLNRRGTGCLDEKSGHYLQVISSSAQKMGDLIDGLLLFSQLGRTELSRARINFEKMVRGIADELSKAAEGRVIQWEIGPLPELVGDAALLRQAVSHLMVNAVKFTQTRSPAKIEIGAFESGGEIHIFLRDNGVGFDARYVHKLFGVFQRLHGPDEFEGTGVGLANVKRIIERHGGRVLAEGAVGVGATFWIILPKPA